MRLIEWAFRQELPTAEKFVLLWLALNANSAGVGPWDRDALERHTGYKRRSMQRLIKSLRDSQHLVRHGIWYAIGNAGLGKIAHDDELAQLPDDIRRAACCPEMEKMLQQPPMTPTWDVEGERLGEIIADHVGDQLNNFEARIMQHIDRMAMFHVEHSPPPAPPPDPVLENPLYGQLLESGMGEARAYKLSEADLDMGEELDSEATPVIEPEEEYPDDRAGRFSRIADILHGAKGAKVAADVEFRKAWTDLEVDENKHTVKGEPDAMLLLYPAIVAAAKANVGKLTMDEFLDRKRIKEGNAPWDRELYPVDKDDPTLMAEISLMLAELEQANDPRCAVQPRTKETGDDGKEHQETVLGYHRRIRAKHREMLKLQQMGVI